MKCIFVNEIYCILLIISLQIAHNGESKVYQIVLGNGLESLQVITYNNDDQVLKCMHQLISTQCVNKRHVLSTSWET